MPYEDDYKMWLEKMLIEMNPDWICEGMHDTEFTHDWCCKYCGKDDLYITPKCLHMFYHHIVRADRKTENSSEKPNNSTISKMEQVDEPQIDGAIDEARFKAHCMNCQRDVADIKCLDCDGDKYFIADEPQMERSSE